MESGSDVKPTITGISTRVFVDRLSTLIKALNDAEGE